jgi:hypothetical protein
MEGESYEISTASLIIFSMENDNDCSALQGGN